MCMHVVHGILLSSECFRLLYRTEHVRFYSTLYIDIIRCHVKSHFATDLYVRSTRRNANTVRNEYCETPFLSRERIHFLSQNLETQFEHRHNSFHSILLTLSSFNRLLRKSSPSFVQPVRSPCPLSYNGTHCTVLDICSLIDFEAARCLLRHLRLLRVPVSP